MPGAERELRALSRAQQPRLVREVIGALVVLGLTGSSVGGLVGVAALATRALGR